MLNSHVIAQKSPPLGEFSVPVGGGMETAEGGLGSEGGDGREFKQNGGIHIHMEKFTKNMY